MNTIMYMTRLIERIGLAMAGLACGTFVSASVGHADIGVLQSEWASLAIVLAGGVGFAAASGLQYGERRRSRIDPVCLLCATGTFLTSVMALTSVAVLVIGADPPAVWLSLLAASWIGGVVLQIAAAGVARYGDVRPPRRSNRTHPTSTVLPDEERSAKRVTLSLALRSSGDAGRGVGRVGAAAPVVAG